MNDKQYKDLESKIDKLDSKLNAIYQILKATNADKFTNALGLNSETKKPKVIQTKKKELKDGKVYKVDIDFDSIIKNASDKGKQIAKDIQNNKYPTVTSGQYKLLMDLKK